MTDEKMAGEDLFYSPLPKKIEAEEEKPLEKIRISSPQPREDPDGDNESSRSLSRRQKNDCHPYPPRGNAKRSRFRGSTYRPSYDQPTSRPTSSHWFTDTEDRSRRWNCEVTRRDDDVQLGERWSRDERKFPRETPYDARVSDRQRKYDSWCPRRKLTPRAKQLLL